LRLNNNNNNNNINDNYLFIYLFIYLFVLGTLFQKGNRNYEGGKNHELFLSRLDTSHFHINIAE